MTVIVVTCPKCQSTQCQPLFYDDMFGCIPCGHEWEIPGPPLTKAEVMAAHAEFGRLDYDLVKKAMGENWPQEWDALGPGEAIFAPTEQWP
jgi:hypothetical protein